MNTKDLKEQVKQKYTEIALQNTENQESNCDSTTCCGDSGISNLMNDDYKHIEGYVNEADLSLGCGLPTEFAKIKEGQTVLDLGSGAGNDCFIARHETGELGKVIGVDFSSAMIERARENALKLNFNNVEFREGDIENMPVADNQVDVVVSNCVLNLLPEKSKIFKEIHRVLKPGGHFSISDIVTLGSLPEILKEDAELYAGCVSGAINKQQYLGLVEEAGFKNIKIQKEKTITLPNSILEKYEGKMDLDAFRKGEIGLFSITVFGEKK